MLPWLLAHVIDFTAASVSWATAHGPKKCRPFLITSLGIGPFQGARMPGYVYVMTNPHMPGVAKIGRMDRNPAERQSALSRSTSVPANFTIEGVVQVENSCAAEVKLHAVFADARTQRGEFFKSAFRQPSGAELIGNR